MSDANEPTAGPLAPDPLAPLLARAVEGDRQAMRSVLIAITPIVTQVVRYVALGAGASVDDLVQECLLELVRSLPRFEGRSSVKHYARRITARHCIGILRRQRARRRIFDRVVQREIEPVAELPSDALAARQREQLVRELVATLPAPQASAVFLRLGAGLGLDEIAEEMAVPVNTVRSRIRLGLGALRERIASDPRLTLALASGEQG